METKNSNINHKYSVGRTKTNSIGSMVPKYTNTANVTKLQLNMAR